MSSIKVVLRKKINSEGKYPIAIRITKNRKTSYIYTGQYIKESDWDKKNSIVKKSHLNSIRLNNVILKKMSEINDSLLESEGKNNGESVYKIKEKTVSKGNSQSFKGIAKEYLKNQEKSGKYSSFLSDRSRVQHFTEFLQNRDIAFSDINELLLIQFRSYLSSEKKLSERSIVNNMILIRTLFNLAIRHGYVDQKYYPFGRSGYKIKIPQGNKIGLEMEDIIAIENTAIPKDSPIWHTRNVWLISFYFAGMRISDVLRLRWSDIKENRLYYTMGKNAKAGSLKIPDKALAIFDFYKFDQKSKKDFIFPELKKVNQNDPKDMNRKIGTAVKQFNKYLKRIGEMAEIDKKITTHIARHSFGNISGDKIPIQMLQKLYRHTSITTTINYQGNFLFKDADDALDAVINS
jgi:site-specific recombinase XerD